MDCDISFIGSDEDSFLTVEVATSPIGGYRGPTGTVTITPVTSKRLSQWSDSELEKLAKEIQTTMKVFEQANISNFLVFGEDTREGFKLSLIPYPTCGLDEKMQVPVHLLFGSPSLSEQQMKEISTCHKQARKQLLDSPNPPKQEPNRENDPFFRDEVIKRQWIKTYEEPSSKIDLLYDYKPLTHDHLLIVPSKEEGHCDGSQVSLEKRVHMLKVARRVTEVLEKQGNEKILFIERNGKLASVPHKHAHVIGIKKIPKTICEKISFVFSSIRFRQLNDKALEKQITKWQKELDPKKVDSSMLLAMLLMGLAR